MVPPLARLQAPPDTSVWRGHAVRSSLAPPPRDAHRRRQVVLCSGLSSTQFDVVGTRHPFDQRQVVLPVRVRGTGLAGFSGAERFATSRMPLVFPVQPVHQFQKLGVAAPRSCSITPKLTPTAMNRHPAGLSMARKPHPPTARQSPRLGRRLRSAMAYAFAAARSETRTGGGRTWSPVPVGYRLGAPLFRRPSPLRMMRHGSWERL